MSEASIARWKSIPSSRTEASVKHSLPIPEQDEADDDDISIASRTPSPPPNSSMDLVHDISKYDAYHHSMPREEITVQTKIKPTNKGFAMLAKLGWTEGQPLGISGDGRVDPIPFEIKRDMTGLGKTNQDFRMIETTVSQRRGLDSERQQKETEDQRRAREDVVARKAALENEISSTLKAFYCALCDKQFKNVAQYDEHTNSYAHHHKARFKDMQANVRLKPKEEIDKRKEKERKREEKELRKIAAANGIKMAKPNPPIVGDTMVLAAGAQVESSSSAPLGRTNWTAGLGEPGQTLPRSGWAAVGSMGMDRPTPQDASASRPSAPPAFRTAGWTSLDTGSSIPANQSPNVTRKP